MTNLYDIGEGMRRQRLAVTATAVGTLLSGVALAIVTATAAQAAEQPVRSATVQTGQQDGAMPRVLAEGDDPDDTPARPPRKPPRHTLPEQLPVPCIGCP
jgi:hypothetical protein